MPNQMQEAVQAVMKAGNGSYVVVPVADGRFLRVRYLWKKLGVAFCTSEGKITPSARRGGGSRLLFATETESGAGGSISPLPLRLALSGIYGPVEEASSDNPD